MELQVHQHFATHIDPSCSLSKATNHILYWIGTAKTMVPKKTQKCGNTGSPCLDKPVLGQGGHDVRFSNGQHDPGLMPDSRSPPLHNCSALMKFFTLPLLQPKTDQHQPSANQTRTGGGVVKQRSLSYQYSSCDTGYTVTAQISADCCLEFAHWAIECCIGWLGLAHPLLQNPVSSLLLHQLRLQLRPPLLLFEHRCTFCAGQ